jgi:methyl-accepting chemotaxis protein
MSSQSKSGIASARVRSTALFLLPLILGTMAIAGFAISMSNQSEQIAREAVAAAEHGVVKTNAVQARPGDERSGALWPALALILAISAAAIPKLIAGKSRRRATAAMLAATNAATGGDLSIDQPITFDNEYGELQSGLAATLAAFRQTIARIERASGELKHSGFEMAQTADEAGHALTEVAQAISSINGGAGHQVELVNEASAVVGSIERALHDAAEHAHEAQAQSANTEQLSEEGVLRAAEVREAMESVRETALKTAAAVRMLGDKSDDIDQIVQTISAIAAQTNMLALNASIEAARAGEQGKGFRNVADEVRVLADDAHSAAEKIASLVHDIQTQTDAAVTVMEAGINHVERGVETIGRNRGTFTDIGAAVRALRESSAEIAELATTTSSGIGILREQIEGVAAVAEQSSSSTAQVSESTQQTSDASSEVSAAAQGVAETAAELAALAGRFRLPGTRAVAA